MKRIYLDHAAATPLDEKVLREMKPFFSDIFSNPSSLHSGGVAAKQAITGAKNNVAKTIFAHPDEAIFTSGGTEANNLAIFGVCEANTDKKHIMTVKTEHSSVLEPVKALEKKGWKVTYLTVSAEGFIDLRELKKMISKEAVLISVMFANNEIGTIQNLSEVGKIILKYRKENNTGFPYIHSDACQAAEYLRLNVEKTHVDLMTFNGGKIYGPKGVGALYVRRGVKIMPIILGGGQEGDLRSGTENVPGIVGFAKALDVAQKKCEKETERIVKLSGYFFDKIIKISPNAVLNGPQLGNDRLANNLNVSFPGVEAEKLVIYLDSSGVQCSTASACTARTNEPSHVLEAIGKSNELNSSAVRFSLGRETTKKDLDSAALVLKTAIKLCAEKNNVFASSLSYK